MVGNMQKYTDKYKRWVTTKNDIEEIKVQKVLIRVVIGVE